MYLTNRKELPKTPKVDLNVKFCQLNISQCDVTEKSERFVVNVYNSIAKTVDKYVRFPVIKTEPNLVFQVLDPKGILNLKLLFHLVLLIFKPRRGSGQ